MKSKARKVIERWVKTGVRDATFIGMGQVFLWPASPGSPDPVHVVVWIEKPYRGKINDEFACDCKGFFYSDQDSCHHIRALRAQIAAAKMKAKL